MSWLAYHFFYHGNRDQLLLKLVRPLVAELFAKEYIDRFFFVRYSLGGPHVRLRLRTIADQEAGVDKAVRSAAAPFFSLWPSTTPLDEEEIRSRNLKLLASDPNEDNDSIYPDNSFDRFPFRPETGRYGGALLAHSLDFFTASSVRCLEFLAVHGDEAWSRRSTHAFRLLARLALGFSCDVAELRALLGYPAATWGEPMEPITAEGDRIFERNRQAFCRLMQTEIQSLADPAAAADSEISRAFAWEIREAPLPVRRTILTSHLHMTANRLGLSNPEEVYLGRILWRAVDELLFSEPALGAQLTARLTERAGAPPPMLLANVASAVPAGLTATR